VLVPWSSLKRINSELFRMVGVTSLAATPIAAGVLHVIERVATAYGLEVALALPLSMHVLYYASLSLVGAQILIILCAPSQVVQFDSSAEHSAHWVSSVEALRQNKAKLEEIFSSRLGRALQESDDTLDADQRERISDRAAKAAASALVKDTRSVESDIANELTVTWLDLQKKAALIRFLIAALFGVSFICYMSLVFWFGPRTLLGLG